MAISREKKQEMVADYVDKVSRSRAVILTDYRGLTVADMTELRQKLREVDSAYQVIKNTLFARALRELGLTVPPDSFQGPIAAGFCLGDSPPVVKALLDFAREHETLQFRGAIMGDRLLDARSVQAIAELPPREVLLAQLLGAIQGPMGNLIGTITAPLRELVQVVKARSEQTREAAA